MAPASPTLPDGSPVQPETSASSSSLRSIQLALALLLTSCVQTPQAPWCMEGVGSAQPRQAFYDARFGWWMYQIQPGDTRSELERVFGLTRIQMQQLNPSMPIDPNFIHAGAFLRVR